MTFPSTVSVTSAHNRNEVRATNTTGVDSRPFPPVDRIKISRAVQVIKQNLEESNDINTAVGCLETLVKVGLTFGNECDAIHQRHVLETIVGVIDVLRNHHQDIDPSVRPSVLRYLDTLEFDRSSLDIKFTFLVKCIRSGLAFSLQRTLYRDTFCGLVFDVASIVLSHSKYDITECIIFLEKSRLDWYICRQIIKSILLQHPDFSAVPENTTGTLYSVLDAKAALEKLEAICPTYESADETGIQVEELTRLELFQYCLLETAHQMLLSTETLPRKGYLTLLESVLGTTSPHLRFKAITLLLVLQTSADALLRGDTLGIRSLEEPQLASTLGLRKMTANHLSKCKPSTGNSETYQLLYESVMLGFKEETQFTQEITLSIASQRDAAHLAIIKLEDSVAQQQMTLAQKVQNYFRKNELEPLLCPISQRPMTDAIYLRCGKTINQAALEELVGGNIPESHCCCEEIHVDIAHKLHDYPLVSDLAIHHLRRALDVQDIVRYGDLPTLRFILPAVKDEEKVDLLHSSVSLKNFAITTFLSSTGANVNAIRDNKTPVIRAASLGSHELVIALLHYGARPEYQDSNGRNALFHAACNGHHVVIEILFKNISGNTLQSVLSGEDLVESRREKCATSLHDIWLGLKEAGDENILYLQRAMELDPENHLYAEEMQVYLDDQESGQADRVYTSSVDEEGNLYEGFIRHGVRSGAGKLVYSENNGRLESFDGEWADGMKKNGLLTYRDGSQYHGDISNDERHGQGILYLQNGAWYEGTWKHDEMDGEYGRYCFENGDVYEGSFVNGTLDGHGKLVHANGDYYDGMWKNGLKHGFGVYDLDSVGLRYEGFWMKDQKHGSGWIIYPDGSQYKGEFINDEPVSDDSSPVERRHSAESRLTVDGESLASSKSDHSRRSATSPSHLAKRHDQLERIIQHERSRSFIDTVGRRIKNPVNM